MPRVLNLKDGLSDEEYRDAIYIGRGSRWGNPWKIGSDGDRLEVIAKHREFVLSDSNGLLSDVVTLRGKDLLCFCSPLPCHGDTLLELANA